MTKRNEMQDAFSFILDFQSKSVINSLIILLFSLSILLKKLSLNKVHKNKRLK